MPVNRGFSDQGFHLEVYDFPFPCGITTGLGGTIMEVRCIILVKWPAFETRRHKPPPGTGGKKPRLRPGTPSFLLPGCRKCSRLNELLCYNAMEVKAMTQWRCSICGYTLTEET